MKLFLISLLALTGCSHLKQSQVATNRHLASNACKQAFTEKKVKSIGIEFEGFYDNGKTSKAEITKHLLKYLDKHLSRKDLYPLTVSYFKSSSSHFKLSSSHSVSSLTNISGKKELLAFIDSKNKRELPGSYFTVSYGKNSQLETWVIKNDQSLTGFQNLTGLEINSPIIRSKEAQNFFLSFLTELTSRPDIFIEHPTVTHKDIPKLFSSKNQDGGLFKVSSNGYIEFYMNPDLIIKNLVGSGGLHIHVGKESFTEKDQVMLIKTLFLIEKEMFNYFNVSKSRRKGLAISSVRDYINDSRQEKASWKNLSTEASINKFATEAIMQHHGKINDMVKLYLNLNPKFNTFEFRLFDSTANPKIIQHEVEFVTKLSQAVLDRDPSFMKFVENKTKAETEITSREFLEFLKILQINPIEIK